jgi:hypothetical protein
MMLSTRTPYIKASYEEMTIVKKSQAKHGRDPTQVAAVKHIVAK